jgi:small basic protein (TIGR04137 family)
MAEKDKKPRSVLKRIERLRILMEKNKWKETDNVFGLPKVKTLRIKIKKEKAEKTETAAAGAEGAAPAAGAGKEQAPAKGAGAKAQEKK